MGVFAYCRLSCRQSSLPADVYESRCDDDHTDRADYHQNYKQFAVVAACLTGPRLATTGSTVVLDAHLITQTYTITQSVVYTFFITEKTYVRTYTHTYCICGDDQGSFIKMLTK